MKNVPGWDQDELFSAIKAFHHDIPAEEKENLKLKHFNAANDNIIRGYFPLLPNDPSHKEFYDMCRPFSDYTAEELLGNPLYEDTPWIKNDIENKYAWIIETFRRYWRMMHATCLELIHLLAVGLGKRPDFFDPWFKEMCASKFRAIYYPPRCHERAAEAGELDESKRKLVAPEHADTGFITVLSTFNYTGL